MKALITGAAGFIGTHLVKALGDLGAAVVSVDSELQIERDGPTEYRGDIEDYLHSSHHGLDGVSHVFHLGAVPGVAKSWDVDYFRELYTEHNIAATQCLLHECMSQAHQPKVIYASSSSVIGGVDGPISPYGVSKQAGESLMGVYAARGVPTVSLRYFTVYGPGQRPDMAFRKWIDAALKNEPLVIYGNGAQSRSFTYVDDVVRATIKAATATIPSGSVFDVGGPEPHTILQAIEILSRLTNTPNLKLDFQPAAPGDPHSVIPNLDLAREAFGYWPITQLERGLEQQIAWQQEVLHA